MDIPNMIVAKTMDRNGKISENKWTCFAHFCYDWELKTNMPNKEDILIRATVYGAELVNSTFGALINMLENKFKWKSIMKEVTVYEECLNSNGMGDLVRCNDCGEISLMQLGGTSCGICGSENLEWYDTNKPEWSVEELEEHGFIVISK